MPQIFDVTANENARYTRNELELQFMMRLADLWMLQIMNMKIPLSLLQYGV